MDEQGPGLACANRGVGGCVTSLQYFTRSNCICRLLPAPRRACVLPFRVWLLHALGHCTGGLSLVAGRTVPHSVVRPLWAGRRCCSWRRRLRCCRCCFRPAAAVAAAAAAAAARCCSPSCGPSKYPPPRSPDPQHHAHAGLHQPLRLPVHLQNVRRRHRLRLVLLLTGGCTTGAYPLLALTAVLTPALTLLLLLALLLSRPPRLNIDASCSLVVVFLQQGPCFNTASTSIINFPPPPVAGPLLQHRNEGHGLRRQKRAHPLLRCVRWSLGGRRLVSGGMQHGVNIVARRLCGARYSRPWRLLPRPPASSLASHLLGRQGLALRPA